MNIEVLKTYTGTRELLEQGRDTHHKVDNGAQYGK